jgi:YbbR domain-containing protein
LKTKKSLIEKIAQDWPAKVLSIGAAIMLFLFNRMSDLDQKYFSVPLAVSGAGQIVPSSAYPEIVRLTLRGDSKKLSFINPGDIEAYLDCSGVSKEGESVLPVRLHRKGNALDADPLEISVDPVQVRLSFEGREIKSVPVVARFSGSPETGYEKASVQVAPAEVEISGPRSLVEKTLSVSTEKFDLSGLKEDTVDEVRLEPPSALIELSSSDSVEIRLTIRQAVAMKTFDSVPILVKGLDPDLQLEGKLPAGVLTVQGSPADVGAFSLSEDTLSVDLSYLRQAESVILPVQLNLPDGLIVVNQEPSEIQLKLGERKRP